MSVASDDDLLARVYSMSEDDDPEISRLRDLRAALRAMPDEEPPERGLAELMAAARAKADEMRPVSWWKRLAALLRRPPVLALASVMVLVGGAVLIGRRGDDEVARPSVSMTESKPAITTGQGSASVQDRFDDGRDRAATQPEPETPAEPAKPEPPKTEDKAPRHVAHGTPAHATAPPPADNRPGGGKWSSDSKTTADTSKEPAVEPKADAEPKPAATKQAQEVHKDELMVEGEAPARPVAPGAFDGRQTSTRKAPAEQLLKQCQVAAARGDCAAAKAIAARIEKDDASFYRERVAKDASIARCLAK